MREKKFTPGPWSWWPFCCDYAAGAITRDGNGTHVAKPVNLSTCPEMTAANAHLIAAAPCLLEALELLVDCSSESQDMVVIAALHNAGAAVRKAYGETP